MKSSFLRTSLLSADIGLLALRLWFGGAMVALHGISKIQNFAAYSEQFLDLFGIGKSASLSLAIFGEVVLAIMLVLGLFTRFAAAGLIITMLVAFIMGHGGQLHGEQSGEMAFIYLGAYTALLIAGPGRFSIDEKLVGKRNRM